MAYAALSTIQTIATGQPFLAATLQQANDNGEFLVDPPACSIKETTPQSVATASDTVLTSDEENFDNDAMHSTVSNTSRVTIQTGGRYLLAGTVSFAANATGNRVVRFLVNGTTQHAMATLPGFAGADLYVSFTKPLVLAASDYVEVQVQQTSGGNLNVNLRDFTAIFITR